MADTRTYPEGEHFALLDQAVQTQTATLTGKVEGLEAEKASLLTTVDSLETEKSAALLRAEAAEKALTDFKADIEAEKAREGKRDERVSALKEANPYLDVTGETDDSKARIDRIVAKSDEDFDSYLTDMREIASKVTAKVVKADEPSTPGGPPRESAAFVPTGDPGEPARPSLRAVAAAAREVTYSAQKGA